MDITSEEDTLIVVTADHSLTFTMGGYPSINNPILGLVDEFPGKAPDDGKPMLTLTYSDGPGFDVHHMKNGAEVPRMNLSGSDTTAPDFVQDAGVPRYEVSHGGEDVAIYARGPMSHLFHGVHEHNYIAHVMEYASCVGANQDHCKKPRKKPWCDECAGRGRSAGLRARQGPLALGFLWALLMLCVT
ncbi:hypothetical protein NP493_7923g00000 [Ridgeia piscesae]|uniref:alkaline phosphatase n=1 Tax=Ridgeia piscesae TaxID=27915 RepID=A0AAD9MKU0_RIDPI|nr:hypothetical protein NP493_7923g00000 [Ridgeia piscesae]